MQDSLTKSAGPIGRAIQYAFYDWTREMSTAKRITAWTGIVLQGSVIWAAIAHSLGELALSPTRLASTLAMAGAYLLGYLITNATLTSELVRKTQLETDQAAARKIQQTLIP